MNYKLLTLTDAVPAPAGSDIVSTDGSAAIQLVAADFAIRANKSAVYVIPFAAAGYSKILLGLFSSPAFNQEFALTLSGGFDIKATITGALAVATLTANTSARFVFGAGAVGQGGTAGGAQVATAAHYVVPALADPFPYIMLSVATQVAPSSGKFTLMVARG